MTTRLLSLRNSLRRTSLTRPIRPFSSAISRHYSTCGESSTVAKTTVCFSRWGDFYLGLRLCVGNRWHQCQHSASWVRRGRGLGGCRGGLWVLGGLKVVYGSPKRRVLPGLDANSHCVVST